MICERSHAENTIMTSPHNKINDYERRVSVFVTKKNSFFKCTRFACCVSSSSHFVFKAITTLSKINCNSSSCTCDCSFFPVPCARRGLHNTARKNKYFFKCLLPISIHIRSVSNGTSFYQQRQRANTIELLMFAFRFGLSIKRRWFIWCCCWFLWNFSISSMRCTFFDEFFHRSRLQLNR